MKKIFCAFALLFALILSSSALAADEKKDDKKPGAPAAGTEGTWTGMLAPASAPGAAASLKVKEDNKNSTFNLFAVDAATNGEIASLLKKKANASVTGTLAPDGVSVKVASITEAEKKKKGK